MLTFKTDDKDLTVFVKGLTKRPDALTQEDLQLLKDNGDPRVIEADDKPVRKGGAVTSEATA